MTAHTCEYGGRCTNTATANLDGRLLCSPHSQIVAQKLAVRRYRTNSSTATLRAREDGSCVVKRSLGGAVNEFANYAAADTFLRMLNYKPVSK